MEVLETPKSADLRAYCGWRGNSEDDIVTGGTIYHDRSSKGIKNGKRYFKDCYRAEIAVDGKRYRHRGKTRYDCEQWLKAVQEGKIKPTDNKADSHDVLCSPHFASWSRQHCHGISSGCRIVAHSHHCWPSRAELYRHLQTYVASVQGTW